ncbi:MAG TPA: Arm DNA-binding domain-containing protein, partial [Flavisolibacter sp.]|nr:Arm DNA-binding domain-containing protein [Flavisolibacter sp.]
MKILFWLYRSHKNSKGLMPLMMRITCKERINLPTQINIEEKAWDTERQQIKGNSDLVKKYNRHLLTLRTKAWDFYNDCIRHNKQFSARDIRQYILGNNAPQHSIIEALDYQINHLKARSGIDIAPSTVKKYETCKRKVIDFL